MGGVDFYVLDLTDFVLEGGMVTVKLMWPRHVSDSETVLSMNVALGWEGAVQGLLAVKAK